MPMDITLKELKSLVGDRDDKECSLGCPALAEEVTGPRRRICSYNLLHHIYGCSDSLLVWLILLRRTADCSL